MLRTVILLQGILASAAASPFHPPSPPSRGRVSDGAAPSSRSCDPRRPRRRIAFMVPRGGATADDEGDRRGAGEEGDGWEAGGAGDDFAEVGGDSIDDPAFRASSGRPSPEDERDDDGRAARVAAIVGNGGGADPPSPSAANGRAVLRLAERYGVADDLPVDGDGGLPEGYGGSVLLSSRTPLQEALRRANADARFLVCYISKGGSDDENNAVAVPALLSPRVVRAINRKPLGKKQPGDGTGSYYVWIADDDGDAEAATRRLKVKPAAKGKGSAKRGRKSSSPPVLAVVYPASAVDPSSGRLGVSPRVLAQHHCRPPPSSPEALVAWMTALRKRHLREFARLQHDRREASLLRERTQGYQSSVRGDEEREEKKGRELLVKKEEEERDRSRVRRLEERRAGLLEALPDEPEAGSEGIITIALRFADGGRDQRRFDAGTTSVNDVFDWIDAVHGMEREGVELSTMNGARKFVYEEEEGGNAMLEEASLGRMTALRVAKIEAPAEEGVDVDSEKGGDENGSEED